MQSTTSTTLPNWELPQKNLRDHIHFSLLQLSLNSPIPGLVSSLCSVCQDHYGLNQIRQPPLGLHCGMFLSLDSSLHVTILHKSLPTALSLLKTFLNLRVIALGTLLNGHPNSSAIQQNTIKLRRNPHFTLNLPLDASPDTESVENSGDICSSPEFLRAP